jgi:hypothetical protein
MEAIFFESITLREGDWLKQQQIDCSDSSDLQRAEALASDIMRSILDATPSDRAGQVEVVALASVVRRIHGQWCQVFPFCRR